MKLLPNLIFRTLGIVIPHRGRSPRDCQCYIGNFPWGQQFPMSKSDIGNNVPVNELCESK